MAFDRRRHRGYTSRDMVTSMHRHCACHRIKIPLNWIRLDSFREVAAICSVYDHLRDQACSPAKWSPGIPLSTNQNQSNTLYQRCSEENLRVHSDCSGLPFRNQNRMALCFRECIQESKSVLRAKIPEAQTCLHNAYLEPLHLMEHPSSVSKILKHGIVPSIILEKMLSSPLKTMVFTKLLKNLSIFSMQQLVPKSVCRFMCWWLQALAVVWGAWCLVRPSRKAGPLGP